MSQAIQLELFINSLLQSQRINTLQKIMEADQPMSTQQTSIFQSLLHKIQMELTQNCNIENSIHCRSEYNHSARSYKSESINWAWQDQCSQTEHVKQPEDLYQLEEIHQLKKIQSSRKDQENKIAEFFKQHKLVYNSSKERTDEDSLQRILRNNLNLSPRKKKIIDKHKNKQIKIRTF